VASSLLALFIVGEVAGRLMERYGHYLPRRRAAYLESNPFLRSALVPNTHFVSGPYHIDVNSLGFRGEEFAVPKRAGTFRIFAVGESSTFGWKGAYTNRDAWPALLEARLRAAYPGRDIEVINAGVPQYTSVEQRINFMLRISKLQPDALLIYHGNNDINWSWVPDVQTKLLYGREEFPSVNTWWNRLADHSYVYMEIRKRLSAIPSSSGAVKHDDPDPAALKMLDDNVRGFIEDARRSNLKVAIATFAHGLNEQGLPGVFSDDERALGVPTIALWFDNLSAQGVRRSFPLYNKQVVKIATSMQLPLCDLASAIPGTPEYHTDWCHLSAKGERAVAEQWFQTIQQAGWLR
jgi:lysophospholipase L1-like esterase